jgi:hypothetical protein
MASLALIVFASIALPSRARADEIAVCADASDQGQDLRDKGAYRRARVAFGTCAREACPAVIRRDCAHWLTELEESAPTVVVSARDPDGNDLDAVRVLLDGEVLQESVDGMPILVDAGAHTFRFEAPGWARIERRVVLRVGEKNRVLDVRFAPGPRANDAVMAAVPAVPRSEKPSGVRPLSLALGGVAALAFGSAAYFGITGLSARSDARAQPCAPACPSSDVDRVRAKFIAADVSLGIGVLALAGAMYVWLARR